jgi:lysophospholipase L1-like esterase
VPARRLIAVLALALAFACFGPGLAAAQGPLPGLASAVAMGDSFASGEGSGPSFDPGTNVGGDRCHRTGLAWPRQLGVPAARHLACSGATIANLTTPQSSLAPDDQGQLVRLAALSAPSAVFVTLGGNDAGFADVLRRCVLASCVGLIRTKQAALPALGARLEAAYRQIAAAARGGRVIVVGYPDIVPAKPPAGLRCPWLGDAEVPAARGFIAALDGTIAAAASRAGVEFVATEDAFAGHELCTASSWVFPVLLNPFSINPQQAHPRPPGQQAMARRVQAHLAG